MARGITILAAFAVLALASGGFALTGSGYSATELFTAGEVRDSVAYPSSFEGVEWADLDAVGLGSGNRGRDVASDGAGNLYFTIHGLDLTGWITYEGVVHWDGADFTNLLQCAWVGGTPPSGSALCALAVSPVTLGPLTAGHPVVSLRSADGTSEILCIDPTASPPEVTLVHGFDTGRAYDFVIADDGTIYGGPMADGTFWVLAWDGSAGEYVEDVVDTEARGEDAIAIGPDGNLYTFERGTIWGTKSKPQILEIDPATGSYGDYALVSAWMHFSDLCFDSEGKFWFVGMKNGEGFVGEIKAGRTVSAPGIASSDTWLIAAGAGSSGVLYVLEWAMEGGDDQPNDAIWELTPGSGGGGKPPKKK